MPNGYTPRPKFPIHLGFTAGGRRVNYTGQKSLILCCPSGWGKLTKSIAWNGVLWPKAYVLNDTKGEGTALIKADREAMGQRYMVINPFGLLPDELGATACINPLTGIGDPGDPNRESNIKALSSAIIVADGTEKFFTDSGKILSDGLISFVASGEPDHRNLTTVHELLSLPRQEWMTWMGAMSRSDDGLARMAAAAFVVPVGQDPPKASWDVLATCRTQYGSFMGDTCIQRVLSRSDFEWPELKDGDLSVSIVLPEAEAKTHFRFTRLLYASMFRALLRPPYAPVFIDMDEVATSMGDKTMDSIETAISLGRGYGVQLQLVFQSMGQAEAMFGKAKMAAILGSCGVHQYGRPNDPMTAKIISERGGSRDVLSVSRSQSESHSTSDKGGSSSWSSNESASMKTVPLYREQDLYHCPDGKLITFVEGCGNPIELYGMDYYHPRSPIRDRVAPNPYLQPREQAMKKLTPEQRAWMQQLNREATNLGIPGWPRPEFECVESCWLADFEAGFTPAEALILSYPET